MNVFGVGAIIANEGSEGLSVLTSRAAVVVRIQQGERENATHFVSEYYREFVVQA